MLRLLLGDGLGWKREAVRGLRGYVWPGGTVGDDEPACSRCSSVQQVRD